LTSDGEKADPSSNSEITIGKVDLVSSTKLRALARKLEVMRLEEPTFKALVFSQFTSFLGRSFAKRLAVWLMREI
jgi:DNA repair protein RAD5